MIRRVALACSVAACGSSHAASPDALPADAAADAAPTAQGPHYHYVLDHVYVPTNNSEAKMYGLDLDHDFVVDNALGRALPVFEMLGFYSASFSETALDQGDTIVLADLQTPGFPASANAGLTFYLGTNPMPLPCGGPSLQCRQHLHGTGSFDVAAAPRDTPLTSMPVSGPLYVGPGHIPIELAPFSPLKPLSLDLIGAYVQVQTSDTALTAGVVGGALPASDVDDKLLPALVDAVQEVVTRDCSLQAGTCTCSDGSQGKAADALFDSNHDCAVTLAEVRGNSLIGSLFQPDVTVEGQSALSFGMGFTAVPATFEVH